MVGEKQFNSPTIKLVFIMIILQYLSEILIYMFIKIAIFPLIVSELNSSK